MLADPPNVLRVSPSYGLETGGQVVEITGENFVRDEMVACVFNGTQSTVAIVESSTKVVCESPRILLPSPGLVAEVSLDVVFEGCRYRAPKMFSVFGA